jgi:hypothetical protein
MRLSIAQEIARSQRLDAQVKLGRAEQRERKARGGFNGGPQRPRVSRFSSRPCWHCQTVFTPLWDGLVLFCSYQCDEAYCRKALFAVGGSAKLREIARAVSA